MSSAACCDSDSSVSASISEQNGANTVYATACTSDASVTGSPVSAFRIGVAPTSDVAGTRPASMAATMKLVSPLGILTGHNLCLATAAAAR